MRALPGGGCPCRSTAPSSPALHLSSASPAALHTPREGGAERQDSSRTLQKTWHWVWKFHIPPSHWSSPRSRSKHCRIVPISQMGKPRLREVLSLHKICPESRIWICFPPASPQSQHPFHQRPRLQTFPGVGEGSLQTLRVVSKIVVMLQQGWASTREVPAEVAFPAAAEEAGFSASPLPSPLAASPGCPQAL